MSTPSKTDTTKSMLVELLSELEDIRCWALTENAPLRQQEINSITLKIEKAREVLNG